MKNLIMNLASYSIVIISFLIQPVFADKLYSRLPPTPTLVPTNISGLLNVNGVHLWYAEYGSGKTIIMLHGGLANSNYWSNQVDLLKNNYRVVLIDSRGHGRSNNLDNMSYSYKRMAEDVIAIMDALKISRSAVVGWSDGAIVGIQLALKYPSRVDKVFSFAANYNPNGLRNVQKSFIFQSYLTRTKSEYKKLSPTPNHYAYLRTRVENMWSHLPSYTREELNKIKTRVWVVDGNRDEAVKLNHTKSLAKLLPNSRLVLEAGLGHFAILQDPKKITNEILKFMEEKQQ